MPFFTNLLAFGIFAIFAYWVWNRLQTRRRHFPLPPGPKGWPVIGNMLDVPKYKPHEVYMEMGRAYQTDLLYFNVAGTPMLIVNSAEAANDLFVERSKLYSDRPQFPMLSLIGWDFAFSTMLYGEKWRKHRARFMQEVSSSNMAMYQKPCVQESTTMFLSRLLDTPQDFADHVHLLFGGAILFSAYGISIDDPHNRYLRFAKESMRGAAEATIPGTYIVDIFPKLRYLPEWFPGISFKKKAAYERPFVEGMLVETMAFVKKNMASGTAKSSMAYRGLQDMHDEGTWSEEEETLLRNVLGAFYAAGTDTTAITAGTIILALVRNSEILKKAQAAIDTVIGPDRLPSFDDEGTIPYVEALVMEALRWRPVAPLAIPHYTRTADIYRGYYIPANTIVLGNSWAVLHDPATYGEDADQFRPERFLNADGTLNRTVPYPDVGFGFGRRACPGKPLAQSALWLYVASLLTCFDITKAIDENGEEIDPSTDYRDGFLLYPPPFKCVIQPRSKVVEGLIRQKIEQQMPSM